MTSRIIQVTPVTLWRCEFLHVEQLVKALALAARHKKINQIIRLKNKVKDKKKKRHEKGNQIIRCVKNQSNVNQGKKTKKDVALSGD